MAEARDVETVIGRARFAARVRRLADAVERGGPFTVRVGGVAVRVPADAVFAVEHEREGGAEEVEFQVRWRRARPRR